MGRAVSRKTLEDDACPEQPRDLGTGVRKGLPTSPTSEMQRRELNEHLPAGPDDRPAKVRQPNPFERLRCWAVELPVGLGVVTGTVIPSPALRGQTRGRTERRRRIAVHQPGCSKRSKLSRLYAVSIASSNQTSALFGNGLKGRRWVDPAREMGSLPEEATHAPRRPF